jgi:hypothetical protein
VAFELHERTLTAIREGRYNLLLGAGASRGATSANGEPLPNGDEYGREISKALGLKVAPGTSLPYVWEAALAKCGGNEADLRARVSVSRFKNCRPAAYHLLVPTLAWRRIYTFNVDDVIPVAYHEASGALQKAHPIHFDEDYQEVDPSEDGCQVVFLHGSELFPSFTVVFGPPAYAATVTRQHTWWHVFADAFMSEPFIVVGATLREPDFESYLALKRRVVEPLDPPSLYVAPDIDDAVLATCKRLSLQPVALKGEDFFKLLDTGVAGRERPSVQRAKKITSTSLLRALKETPALATLARQYIVVSAAPGALPTSDRAPERFYEGHTPEWEDIQAGRDVQTSVESVVVDDARQFLTAASTTPPIRLSCVEGTAGSGKTTALMRTALALSDGAADVLFFVGRERLRDEVLIGLAQSLSANEAFVLVIDDIAGHVNQVRRLIAEYPTDRGRCLILGAVRSGQKGFLERNLAEIIEPRFFTIPTLSPGEALDLVTKLRGAAKLGPQAGKTDAVLVQRFVGTKDTEWGGQLLAILLEVVPGGKFVDRLRSEWDALPDDTLKWLYGIACLAAACGAPVRSALAFKAAGAAGTRLLSDIFTGALRGLISWSNREYLLPRHRVVGEQTVLKCMNREELYQASLRLAVAIAPYVSRKAIMNRTPEAQLARRLMDADGVVIPGLGSRAAAWFGEIERDWNWNSRFWEQRALVALRAGQLSRARDYAEQAIGIERHPLPMTTCALVRLLSAERDSAMPRESRRALFDDGVKLIDEAIDLANARGFVEVHPYHILLNHAVRVSRALLKDVPPALRRVLRKHAPDAELHFGADQGIKNALRDLRAKHLL